MPSDPPLTAFALNCTLKSSKAKEKAPPTSSSPTCWRPWSRTASPARWSAPPTTTSCPASQRRGRGRRLAGAAQADPRRRHPDRRDADLARPAVEHRQARSRAAGCVPGRDRRQGPDAVLRQGGGSGGRRQRGRRPPLPAATFQALNDVGFTLPAGAGAYWVGEAMGSVNYVDLKSVPKPVQQTLDMLASNAAHLARLLKRARYPGVKRS